VPLKVIPDRYRYAVIPHIMIDGASAAIEFYKAAFGATEIFRIEMADNRILHAEIQIEQSVVMVGDGDETLRSPKALGGSSVGLHVYVDDVDSTLERAESAGAKTLQAPQDLFYGDRMGKVADPFGHIWIFLTHKEDMSPNEIVSRAKVLIDSETGSVDENLHPQGN
jgi:PhnB protein